MLPLRRRELYAVLLVAAGLLTLAAGVFQAGYEQMLREAEAEFRADRMFFAGDFWELASLFPFADPRARYNAGVAKMVRTALLARADFQILSGRQDLDPRFRADVYYMEAWTVFLSRLQSEGSEDDFVPLVFALLEEALHLDPGHLGAKRFYELLSHIVKAPSTSQTEKPELRPGQQPGPRPRDPKP